MLKIMSVSLMAAMAFVPAQGANAAARAWTADTVVSSELILEAKAVKKDPTAKEVRKAKKKAAKAARKAKRDLARDAKKAKEKARTQNPKWSDEHAAFVDQARNTDSGIGNGGETPDFVNGGWMAFPSESLDRDPANSRLQCQGGKNPNRC